MASNQESQTKIPSAINPRDSEFMWRVVQNLGPNPVIDWHTVAAEMGLKSAGVAKVRFGQIKKKFVQASLGNAAGAPAIKDESVIGSGTNVTPTKVRKSRAPAATPKTPPAATPKTPKNPQKKAPKNEKKRARFEDHADFEDYEELVEHEKNLAEENEQKKTKLEDRPEYYEDFAEEHEESKDDYIKKTTQLDSPEYYEDLQDQDASPYDYQYVEAERSLGRS